MLAMSRTNTPRGKRTASRKVNTPGDASVTSTGSLKPGVPWNIQKQFAQELENKYPLVHCPTDGNSVKALLDTGYLALSRFLDDLIDKDPESINIYGPRASRIAGTDW